MLIIFAIIITVATIMTLIYAATKPDSFRIERSIDIKAPPEKIFPLIIDFHHMNTWSA